MNRRLILAGLGGASLLFGQEAPPPKFDANSNLVQIGVQVYSRVTRQPVVGLRRGDFIVLDESAPSELKVFDNSPLVLSLMLLIDVSGGFTNTQVLNRSAEVRRSLEPDDRVALMSFSDGAPMLRTDFTNDEGAVQRGWQQIINNDRNNGRRSVKTSRLLDALSSAADHLRSTPPLRGRAVVVITHNREKNSTARRSAVIEALLESSAVVEAIVLPQEMAAGGYAFGLGIPGWSGRTSSPEGTQSRFLEDLHSVDQMAEETGGQVLHVHLPNAQWTSVPQLNRDELAGSAIGFLVDELMARLRSQYTLGIQGVPTGKREFRRLSVRLSDDAMRRFPNAIVRARAGYWTIPAAGDGKRRYAASALPSRPL